MSDFVYYISNVSFVVSIILFFFSLMQLVRKNKPASSYFLSLVYLSVGIQCLSLWFYYRSSPFFERFLYYSDSAFLFLIGPFLYLFFLYITDDRPILPKQVLFHSVPFFTSLFFIEGFNLYYPVLEDKKNVIEIKIIIFLSYLSLLVYLIGIMKTLVVYHREKKQSSELKALICIIFCSVLFALSLLFSSVGGQGLQYISHVAFLCISLSFIIFLIRYPDYFNKAQKEYQKIRYIKSRLGHLDKERMISHLESLMKEEKIYRDSSLSLNALSVRLDISSSQLSELLNSCYESNFNAYINSYRIDEIKRLLETEEDLNILQTAFDCGFNSKTTFNTSFRKHTGLTPTEYRKKNRSDL